MRIKLAIAFMLGFVCQAAFCAQTTIYGYYSDGSTTPIILNYTVNGDEVEITMYEQFSNCAISPNDFSGTITVPKWLSGRQVTSIGDYSFNGCNNLTSVNIPDSVRNIGSASFNCCSAMTSVNIPSSVRNIDMGAFGFCNALKIITIPNSVTNIGESAFTSCEGLETVEIGGGVVSMGCYAFLGCVELKTLTISDGVKCIGAGAFNGCSALTSVAIPGSVEVISSEAFAHCAELASVTINEGVKIIAERAFLNCPKLASVTIPASVTSISPDAFEDCPKLQTAWSRAIANIAANSEDAVKADDLSYGLENGLDNGTPKDRTIHYLTVGSCDTFSLNDFVPAEDNGKAFDTVIYVHNPSMREVTLTLPEGHTYTAIKGTTPLVIPPESNSILSITRVTTDLFLVTREELQYL